MKKIWLSSLVSSEDAVKEVMSKLKTYGLEAYGHFWEDDLEKMAWIKPRGELLDQKTALWGILGAEKDFQNPSFRYGLSLLAVTVQAARGPGFPIVLLQTDGSLISPDTLTTSLRGVDILSVTGAAYGPKLVAKVHQTAGGEAIADYRLDVIGNEHLGQWFEAGPRDGEWSGGMFAVAGAEIVFQGVGPKGSLPEKSILNYPIEGLKVNLGDKEYVAWAVQNELGPETSHFVKVKGAPESILFGPYSSEEEAEVYVFKLK